MKVYVKCDVFLNCDVIVGCFFVVILFIILFIKVGFCINFDIGDVIVNIVIGYVKCQIGIVGYQVIGVMKIVQDIGINVFISGIL